MAIIGFIGFIFGMVGFVFALISYSRIDKLEERLKEKGVLEESFKSVEENW